MTAAPPPFTPEQEVRVREIAARAARYAIRSYIGAVRRAPAKSEARLREIAKEEAAAAVESHAGQSWAVIP